MLYVWLPIGIVIGFISALVIMLAMAKANKRAEDDARRDRLRGIYGQRKLGD